MKFQTVSFGGPFMHRLMCLKRPQFLRKLRKSKPFQNEERGVASVEFVLWFPVFLTLFLTSYELSYYSLRSVLLERALSTTIRELRMGIVIPEDLTDLKQRICDRLIIGQDCMTSLSIDMREIDDETWDLPWGKISCVDRKNEIDPVTEYTPGSRGVPMLLRVCLIVDPFFSTTPFVIGLPTDASGGIAMTSVTSYVNEP